MNKIWMNTLAWAGAALAAVAFAFLAPNENSVMGRLPSVISKRLDPQQNRNVALPAELPADRTLALVTFQKGHRDDIDSWINGLRLVDSHAITWVRMPVLNDPGDAVKRDDIETRLLAHYRSSPERARVLPVFTDRNAFIRATGLADPDHAYAMVLDRNGDVLARVEGQFDEDKGQALRETLLAQAMPRGPLSVDMQMRQANDPAEDGWGTFTKLLFR